ncbi:MAG: hypothetical protein HYZ52_00565 [Candidatus Omnitrophica bacterium]|nr:hypothetical protein [Candidatus Omnitrophota bacterium]
MIKTVAKTNYFDKFTIATYRDHGKWVAHNLSLDIVATAKSKPEAIKELGALTVQQVDFAISHHMPEAINHPAPTRFWQTMSEKVTASLVGRLFGSSVTKTNIQEIINHSTVIDLSRPSSRFAKAR